MQAGRLALNFESGGNKGFEFLGDWADRSLKERKEMAKGLERAWTSEWHYQALEDHQHELGS
jgi:hypothetical protein